MVTTTEDDLKVWKCQKCFSRYLKFLGKGFVECAIEGCEAKHFVAPDGRLYLCSEKASKGG